MLRLTWSRFAGTRSCWLWETLSLRAFAVDIGMVLEFHKLILLVTFLFGLDPGGGGPFLLAVVRVPPPGPGPGRRLLLGAVVLVFLFELKFVLEVPLNFPLLGILV